MPLTRAEFEQLVAHARRVYHEAIRMARSYPSLLSGGELAVLSGGWRGDQPHRLAFVFYFTDADAANDFAAAAARTRGAERARPYPVLQTTGGRRGIWRVDLPPPPEPAERGPGRRGGDR